MQGEQRRERDREFIRRILIVLTLAALFFLVWEMRSLLLLIFGAVLVAAIKAKHGRRNMT